MDDYLTLDDLFRVAADLEPWFGGLYVENGQLRIRSTDAAVDRSRMSAVVAGILDVAGRADLRERIEHAEIVPARYSFSELAGWLNSLLPVLYDHGVHSMDINEANNTIDLAPESSTMALALEVRAAGKGVPPDAVQILARERIRINEGIGGAKVTIEYTGVPTKTCTLTQVVERRVGGTVDLPLYAIVNSHCTGWFASNVGSIVTSFGVIIADEVWDHPRFTNPECESLMGTTAPRCRLSDAALFRYRSSYAVTLHGPLHPHQVHPYWKYGLHDEELLLFQGEVVNMYGFVTGPTYGEITATCTNEGPINLPHPQNPAGLLCQYRAAYSAQEGDSGGPVWFREPWDHPWLKVPEGFDSTPEDVRRFVGIHWGDFPGGGAFSPAAAIFQEITPDEPGWGTICLSLNSMFCTY